MAKTRWDRFAEEFLGVCLLVVAFSIAIAAAAGAIWVVRHALPDAKW